jgi:hypothetical protein
MHGLYNKRFYALVAAILIAVLYAMQPLAATQIILHDGTVIKVNKKKNIFVSSQDTLFVQATKNGNYRFNAQRPLGSDNDPVGPVPNPSPTQPDECALDNYEGCDMGSVEYCTYFQATRDGGYTFGTTYALRSCDTNGDGNYQFCTDYTAAPEYDTNDQFRDKYCDGDVTANPVLSE